MVDIKPEIQEVTQIDAITHAINIQARLLIEIVKAADHIVKSYVELVQKKETANEEAKKPEEPKPNTNS